MPRFRNARTGVVVSTATAPAGAGWEALDAPTGGTARETSKPTRRKTPRQRTTAARTAEEPAPGSTDHDDAASASQRSDD